MNWWKALAIPGALVAVITIWGTLGFPTVATSADVKRLDRTQTQMAVELYNTKVRNLLLLPEPSNPTNSRIWQEELEKAKRQRDAAEQRLLELGD